MTSSPQAKPSRRNELAVRAASAGVLIPVVLLAVFLGPSSGAGHGGYTFLCLMAVGALVLGLEWGRMCEPRAPRRIGAVVVLGVWAALLAGWLDHFSVAFVLLVFGAAGAGLFSRLIGSVAVDAAYGVLYIGWPCVVLIWLRMRPDGLGWTVMLFAIAWAADICAYLLGSLLKGPRLWPRFSPNKTWSGFVGGLVAGVIAAVLVARWMDVGLTLRIALVVGFVAALATMGGDLWESALKRRFGVKDAGDLIPGHGGLLDRVDGMMFAVVALAASRVLVQGLELA